MLEFLLDNDALIASLLIEWEKDNEGLSDFWQYVSCRLFESFFSADDDKLFNWCCDIIEPNKEAIIKAHPEWVETDAFLSR